MAVVHDMTTGPIRGHLMRMTAFMLVGMVVQIVYSLIDLYWVGHLGKDAVAAVGLCSNLQIAVLGLTQILSVGTGAIVAQAAGRQDHAEVRRLFNQSLLLALGLGILFGTALTLGAQGFAQSQSGDEATADNVRRFLVWFTPALVLQFPMVALGSALRGIGDMRAMMATQLGTVLLNIVLAPFLIFGWLTRHPLGIAGASLATLIAISAGTVGLFLHVLRRGGCFDPQLRDWLPRRAVWARVVRIGLPSGAEFAILALYMFFVMAVIRRFGAEAQAAFGIGSRLLQAGMMAPMAVAFAAGSVAGQNIGARRLDRVRSVFAESLKVSVAVVILFFALFHAVPDALFHAFTRDRAVIGIGEEYLRIISWNLLATGVVMACFGIFTGMGNTLPSLIGSATRIVLVVVPVALLMHRADFQMRWIWELSAAGTVVQMAVNLVLLRSLLQRAERAVGAPVPLAA